MKSISFLETSPAPISGHKAVTRRDWKQSWADGFRAGELVSACNRRREWGGREIAVIRLTAVPTFEPMAQMPDADYEGEGFVFLYAHPELLCKTRDGVPVTREDYSWAAFLRWRVGAYKMWVVRFELIEVPAGTTPENCRR